MLAGCVILPLAGWTGKTRKKRENRHLSAGQLALWVLVHNAGKLMSDDRWEMISTLFIDSRYIAAADSAITHFYKNFIALADRIRNRFISQIANPAQI